MNKEKPEFIPFSIGIISVAAILTVLVTSGWLIWVQRHKIENLERSRETLTYISKEFSKINTTNLILAKENTHLQRYSFQFVMQTLTAKAIKYKIPLNVAMALMQIESSFNPQAESSTGDHGLFQINYDSWHDKLDIDIRRLQDPEYNIELGLFILAYYKERAGSWPMALAYYNRGKNFQLSEHPKKLEQSGFMK